MISMAASRKKYFELTAGNLKCLGEKLRMSVSRILLVFKRKTLDTSVVIHGRTNIPSFNTLCPPRR